MELTPNKVKKIGHAIKEIFLKDWDPIGIYKAGPDDEYDSYIWSIFKLLRNGAEEDEITNYLYQLEIDITGSFPESKESIAPVSKKLISLVKKMKF